MKIMGINRIVKGGAIWGTAMILAMVVALSSATAVYGQQLSQLQPMPGQQMPMQMSPGPLDGSWMANNGISAMFSGNFYVLAYGQAMEGGTFMIQGGEMITQVMQGQSPGQQMRYTYQPGPDGKSFTLLMPNGGGSITYQRMGDLPTQTAMPPMQQMPQQGQGQFPQMQQMPQQGQGQFPQMQQMPQMPQQ